MIEYAHLESEDNGATWKVIELYKDAKSAERAVEDATYHLHQQMSIGYKVTTPEQALRAAESIKRDQARTIMVGWRRVDPSWTEYNSWDPPLEGVVAE